MVVGGGRGGMAGEIANAVAGEARRGLNGGGIDAGAGLPTIASQMLSSPTPDVILSGIVNSRANVTAPLFDFEIGSKGMNPAADESLAEAMALADAGPPVAIVPGALMFGASDSLTISIGAVMVVGAAFFNYLMSGTGGAGRAKPDFDILPPGARQEAKDTYDAVTSSSYRKNLFRYPKTIWFDLSGVLLKDGAPPNAPMQGWAVGMLLAFKKLGAPVGIKTTNDAKFVELFLDAHPKMRDIISKDENGRSLIVTGEEIDVFRGRFRNALRDMGMAEEIANVVKPLDETDMLIDDSRALRDAIDEHVERDMGQVLIPDGEFSSKGLTSDAELQLVTLSYATFYAGDVTGVPTGEQIRELFLVAQAAGDMNEQVEKHGPTIPDINLIVDEADVATNTVATKTAVAAKEVYQPTVLPGPKAALLNDPAVYFTSLLGQVEGPRAADAYIKVTKELAGNRHPPHVVWFVADGLIAGPSWKPGFGPLRGVGVGMAKAFRDSGVEVGLVSRSGEADVKELLGKNPELAEIISRAPDGSPLVRDGEYLRAWRAHLRNVLESAGIDSSGVDGAFPVDPDEMIISSDTDVQWGITNFRLGMQKALGAQINDYDVGQLAHTAFYNFLWVPSYITGELDVGSTFTHHMANVLAAMSGVIRHDFYQIRNGMQTRLLGSPHAWPSRDVDSMTKDSKDRRER
jgi:hypothetical protein